MEDCDLRLLFGWDLSHVYGPSAASRGNFRGSHDVISTGINRDTVIASVGESIRLLDDRWVIQGNGVQLDGSAPRENQVGIYAELTPVKL